MAGRAGLQQNVGIERIQTSVTPTVQLEPNMTRISIALLSVILALAGCQTNPVTGRQQLMLVSESTAISESAHA